ncbi:MAG: hypothetical protein ACRCZK_01640 [Oscillospiraceae bacterium]
MDKQKEVISLFTQLSIIYDKEVTSDLVNLYITMFKEEKLNIDELILSIKSYLKIGKFFPKPADLIELIKPQATKHNLGLEYATDLLKYASDYGVSSLSKVIYIQNQPHLVNCQTCSIMGDKVLEKYGQAGYKVFEIVKDRLRILEHDENNTFIAQTRDLFNSVNESFKANPKKLDETLKLGKPAIQKLEQTSLTDDIVFQLPTPRSVEEAKEIVENLYPNLITRIE